jgi:hypothetical protein
VSGASTTFTTARFLTPDYLVQGQDNELSCPLWRDGVIVEVDSGTVSVYDASGAAIVSGAAVTVDGDGIATYTLPAASTTSRPRGMGWRVEWSLEIGSAETTYRNSAGLVRSQLAPCITDQDLFDRVSGLDPTGDAPLSTFETYQTFINSAWVTIHGRLVGKGSLPHLIMEPSALRETHILLTLTLLFEDFRTRLNENYATVAAEYRQQYKDEWNGLVFEYDTADAGASDGRRKRSASPTCWLGGFD